MKATLSPLHSLPPELFPLVGHSLPLYSAPPTLLSLALTDRAIYDVIYPLLYSRIILRNEGDTISVFERLLNDPDLGRFVRELHVKSELSVESTEGKTRFDSVTGLKEVIRSGTLPHLHTLELRLLHECRRNDEWCTVSGFGHLESEFWANLRRNCPQIRTIELSGIGDTPASPWIAESGLYELKGFENLKGLELSFVQIRHADGEGPIKLLHNIKTVSNSLTSLHLNCNHYLESASPILSLDFPRLQHLTLASFSVHDIKESMAFWERHPNLIELRLDDTEYRSRWFSETVSETLLPALRYLTASFRDVMSLTPVLPRLKHISIQQSINCQVPYLLRALIPRGLPGLASLEIDQAAESERDTIRLHPGSTWYETSTGEFRVEKNRKNMMRNFKDGYIHSLVKGAPNLEELCLHGSSYHPFHMEAIAADLGKFARLKRFYFRGVNDSTLSLRTRENKEAFYVSSQNIAKKCATLERITDISNTPYLAAVIVRNGDGDVEQVIEKDGYGTLVGSEDKAFPRNPRALITAG